MNKVSTKTCNIKCWPGKAWLLSFLLLCVAGLSACLAGFKETAAQEAPSDWRSDWGVEEGFSINVDTEGYHYPSAIAFIPKPGRGPKDPLYFVTELRGQVKVVTNDRTIYTFAKDFLQTEYYDEAPMREAEFGLAGICLDSEHGYVFVTFAYQDKNKILRNNIIRFQSKPETFSIEPEASVSFTDVFSGYESGPSHQIGPCQVDNDFLYVSIGDGFNSPKGSQKTDTLQGKIIRMTLDGYPVPDNPFYEDNDIKKAANYIWAYGLRNPFSLKVMAGRVFVADNGPNVDRFLEIEKGQNYLWNGTDESIAINARAVLIPSLGPVQMDYSPTNLPSFPEQYREKFYVALSATEGNKIPGVLSLDYSLKESRMLSTPKYFVKYQGDQPGPVTGLAFGPDGLYFFPIMPNRDGETTVLRVTYDPPHQSPFLISQNRKPLDLMYEKGCFGCHSMSNQLKGGTAGPSLDSDQLLARLQSRLNSEAYLASLKEIDLLDSQPQVGFKAARQEVAAAKGIDRVRTWLQYRIQEPKFDNLYSQMPNLEVSNQEAEIITDYLLQPASTGASGWLNTLRNAFSWPRLLIFGVGLVMGGTLVGLALLAKNWYLKTRQAGQK